VPGSAAQVPTGGRVTGVVEPEVWLKGGVDGEAVPPDVVVEVVPVLAVVAGDVVVDVVPVVDVGVVVALVAGGVVVVVVDVVVGIVL